MKKPSVSAFIRLNPSKTGGAINLLYVYDRVKKPFPLQESVPVSDWNDKDKVVKLSHPRALDINKKKRVLQNDLLDAADFLMKNGIKPYPDKVAEEYKNILVSRQNDAEQQKQKATMTRGLQAATYYEIAEADAKLEQLEHQKAGIIGQKTEILKEAELYGFAVDLPVSEKTVLFMNLLKEFVVEKSGCWIDDSAEVKRLYNDGTKKGYRSWASNFVSWTKSDYFKSLNIPLTFDQLDKVVYQSYGNYLMDPKGNHKMYDNSFGGQVKKAKEFFGWVAIEKKIPVDARYDKHWDRLSEKKQIIWLSPTEINLLWDEQISPEEEKYKDLTVFGCLTSLRISDIKATQGVILDDNGFLRGRTQKNRNDYKIDTKLDERILTIGNKYNWDLDLCTEQSYNKNIKLILKALFEKHNINQRKIKVYKYRWQKLVKDSNLKYKYELFTAHCCRRSWVTNMSARGISDGALMEMMGSKSVYEYNKYKAVKVKHIRDEVDRTAST